MKGGRVGLAVGVRVSAAVVGRLVEALDGEAEDEGMKISEPMSE